METQITDGKINLKGNFVFREKPKRADYLLYLSANNPIAVIEAKDNNHSISHGLQQAMEYAKMLDLPFAFSSNGDGFAEHDFLTGKEREFGLDEFPTEAELIARYKKESGLTNAQEIAIDQPYSGHGHRYWKNLYRISNCLPLAEKRNEAKGPLSGRPQYFGGSIHPAGLCSIGKDDSQNQCGEG